MRSLVLAGFLAAFSFAGGCSRARDTTEINTAGSRTRNLVFTGQEKKEGSTDLGGSIEDSFVLPTQLAFSPHNVNQLLAELRLLETDPAHSVRGPKYVVKKGKTPVLNTDEARALLDSMDRSLRRRVARSCIDWCL